MASRWSWLALGVGAYLAFTLAAFPAAVAVRWFAPENISLVGIQGSLWAGSAATGTAAGLSFEDARWRVQPWALLTGRIAGALEARLPDGFIATNLEASPSRIVLTGLRGGTSLSTLAGMLPLRGTRGQASVAIESLEIENGWPSRALGEVRLADLQVPPFGPAGSELLPLGNYTITFQDDARGIAATFVDSGGPLETSGTIVLDAARKFVLDAWIKPRPQASPQLVQGLTIMAADTDAEGRRHLIFPGSL